MDNSKHCITRRVVHAILLYGYTFSRSIQGYGRSSEGLLRDLNTDFHEVFHRQEKTDTNYGLYKSFELVP